MSIIEKIRSIININKINVVLFQETHVENLKFKNEVDSFFNCQSLWSFGFNNSCGVATLIIDNFDFKFLSFKKDNDGRAISVKININECMVNIVNVYAPNNLRERKEFFNSSDRYIFGSDMKIIGGDWNFIESLKYDKIGGKFKCR